MKEQTGLSYQTSRYAKLLAASDAKVGKTFFLVLGTLGLLPWQRKGGIVDRPSHLHVVTVDANALGGIKRGAKELCGANDEALGFHVYNMQDDFNLTHASDSAWDLTFYNTLQEVQRKIGERVAKTKGTHVVLISSLTGIAAGLLRGIQGPPGQTTEGGNVKKGSGMDQAKWSAFAAQVSEIRSIFQLDLWHCIWEGHLFKPQASGQNKDDEAEAPKEGLQIPGKSGVNFAYNVEQIFRIRRNFGKKYVSKTGTRSMVDETFFDTAPSLDFITGGRNVTESLAEKEYDPTSAFDKLGLQVGFWGRQSDGVVKKIKKVK